MGRRTVFNDRNGRGEIVSIIVGSAVPLRASTAAAVAVSLAAPRRLARARQRQWRRVRLGCGYGDLQRAQDARAVAVRAIGDNRVPQRGCEEHRVQYLARAEELCPSVSVVWYGQG